MDYEKKYNEALKRFKAFKEKYYTKDTNIGDAIYDKTGNMQKDFEAIFPELRESEDEEIRQQLLWLCDEWEHNPDRRTIPADIGNIKQIRRYLEKQKEPKPAECRCTNNESEYDKGYRAGHRFGLKQTQDYMIGKTFKGLIPCWINAPSTLSPLHQYHGKNAVVMHENNGGFRCICIDEKEPVSFHIPSGDVLVEGWKEKPLPWSKEDEEAYAVLQNYFKQTYDGRSTSITRREVVNIYNFLNHLKDLV